MCIFIVRIYVKAWFTAPNLIASSNHDFHFLKLLDQYETMNTRKTFVDLLWYSSEELTGLACFYATVPIESNAAMVKAITEKKDMEEPAKRDKMNKEMSKHAN